MRTKVTKRGQVEVPPEIRKKLHIRANTTLEWAIEGNTARIIPIVDDAIDAFRGSGPKGQVRRLLKERRQDRHRENGR